MLYFKFKNYEEFKERFGMRTTFSGSTSRNNGILLAFLKGEFSNGNKHICVETLDEMYDYILTRLKLFALFKGNIFINGCKFYLPDKATDSSEGICDDGDIRSIRYIRKSDGRVYKMKAGKFMRLIIMECPKTKDLPEQAVIWFCETFAEKWKAHVQSLISEFTLVVNDDFKSIYDKSKQKGDLHSCMNGKPSYRFYNDCVKAKAASLINREGLIVARCVIFTEVKKYFSDKVYRLAERQYSTDEENYLKQLLVDKLIEAGEIDGYKMVGAGCHDPHSFVMNDGSSFNHDLYIKANIGNQSVPYMDSFKYYDEHGNILHNEESDDFDWILENTSGHMERPSGYVGEWDGWNSEYCESVVNVRYWTGTRWDTTTCNRECLEDFEEIDGEYYESAHCYWSNYHNGLVIEGHCVYSRYLDSELRSDMAIWKEDADSFFPSDDDSYYERWLAEQEELVEAI